MSLKAELETWASALQAYDEENFERALELFTRIADSSKILCNMGLIYATMGEHEAAVERFIDATNLDQYLAVAYFQCGVSHFLLGCYDLAYKDFDEALLYLRGNQAINYEQLGLQFRLYSAEVLFNKGLSLIYMGRIQQGLADMEEARKEKATEEHNVIDDAISERGEGYTVFSIPVGILYRPSERKLKNSVTKDYLGKAILVAATDPTDNTTEFSGAARLKQGISPAGIFLGPPKKDDALSPRSFAVSPSSATGKPDGARPLGVERSNTTALSGRENSSVDNKLLSVREYKASQTVGLYRSKTQITPVRITPNATDPAGGQGRGAMRRLSTIGGITSPISPQDIGEIYAGYTSREMSPIEPRSISGSPWPPASALSRSTSRGAQNTPGLGRQNTRNAMAQRRNRSPQDDEQEYGSEPYESGLTLIRVKICRQDDVRGMTMSPDIGFAEFLAKIYAKFQRKAGDLDIKFTDEDGAKISLQDESDFEMAIETARSQAKGRSEGKLELWCREL
jgi:hypothetical protein